MALLGWALDMALSRDYAGRAIGTVGRGEMAFSESIKDQAFQRCNGQCECTRHHTGATTAPHRGGRCPNTFMRNGAWEAHHRVGMGPGGGDTLSNCEALCLDCYGLTPTYR